MAGFEIFFDLGLALAAFFVLVAFGLGALGFAGDLALAGDFGLAGDLAFDPLDALAAFAGLAGFVADGVGVGVAATGAGAGAGVVAAGAGAGVVAGLTALVLGVLAGLALEADFDDCVR